MKSNDPALKDIQSSTDPVDKIVNLYVKDMEKHKVRAWGGDYQSTKRRLIVNEFKQSMMQ